MICMSFLREQLVRVAFAKEISVGVSDLYLEWHLALPGMSEMKNI
jgi:hypothetical protein